MKKKPATSSRRDFLKTTTLIAGGVTIVPRHVLGRGFIPPSDKLQLAAIGAGGKGWSDISHAYNNGAEEVVALCDVDTRSAQQACETWPKAAFYKDFRRMLEEMKDSIDAVTISTPDHVHGIAAMTALQLGIDVYVQKPLTHNIYEARRLTEAAREYRRVTQMGNQGASNPEQQQLIEWFDQGLIGTVHTVHVWTDRPVWPQGIPAPEDRPPLPAHLSPEAWDLFIGPASPVPYHPLYHPFKWRGWWRFGTGALGDMGCHLIDAPFNVLRLGYPTEVECSVGQVFTRDWVPEYIPEGCPPSSVVRLKFPATAHNASEVILNWSDGGIRPFHPERMPADHPLGSVDSTNGVIIEGTEGVMVCGYFGAKPRIYKNNGDVIEMPEGGAAANPLADLPEFGHQVAWTRACKAGYGSAEHKALTSSFDVAGPLAEVVLMGNLAIRSYTSLVKEGDQGAREFYGRRKLLWDGQAMKITNFDDANQFVSRTYREGWKLI